MQIATSTLKLTSLDDVNDVKIQIHDFIQQNALPLIKTEFDSFFQKHPEVDKIAFTAYTPYFMDGDPCVYSVNEYHYLIPDEPGGGVIGTEEDEWEDEDEEEVWYEWPTAGHNYKYDPIEKKYMIDTSFFDKYPSLHDDMVTLETRTNDDDLCLTVYGDHVIVRVDRNGFIVEECSHD